MPTNKELYESRAAKFAEAQTFLNKKDVTAEDKAKFDTIMSEVDAIGADIKRQERAESMDKELRAIKSPAEQNVVKDGTKTAEQLTAEQTEAEKRSFYNFCTNHGDFKGLRSVNMRTMETRTDEPGLSTDTASAGYLIPPYFMRNLEVAMKYYAPFASYADIVDTPDGAPMTWPVSSDVGNVAKIVPEGEAVEDVDIGIDKVTFGAHKYGTLVKVSMEISQDAFNSVDGMVTDAFAIRFGRGLSKDFTTGVGITEPKGIVTCAVNCGTAVTGDDNSQSPNPLTQVGYLDLLALLHSVDPAYRDQPGAAFMLGDNTLRYLRAIKDLFGRPLWAPGISVSTPDAILGKPYIINNFMDDLKANGKAVIFGDLKRYKVRRVRPMFIQRLVERYAEKGQIGLIAWARYDGNLLDAGMHPVKYLQCPAS